MSKNAELKTVLPVLGNLTNEELQEVANHVARIVLDRKNLRKKELWGNVKAAIAKYESEIEPITFYCRCCGEDCTIDEIESDNPGNITIS